MSGRVAFKVGRQTSPGPRAFGPVGPKRFPPVTGPPRPSPHCRKPVVLRARFMLVPTV